MAAAAPAVPRRVVVDASALGIVPPRVLMLLPPTCTTVGAFKEHLGTRLKLTAPCTLTLGGVEILSGEAIEVLRDGETLTLGTQGSDSSSSGSSTDTSSSSTNGSGRGAGRLRGNQGGPANQARTLLANPDAAAAAAVAVVDSSVLQQTNPKPTRRGKRAGRKHKKAGGAASRANGNDEPAAGGAAAAIATSATAVPPPLSAAAPSAKRKREIEEGSTLAGHAAKRGPSATASKAAGASSSSSSSSFSSSSAAAAGGRQAPSSSSGSFFDISLPFCQLPRGSAASPDAPFSFPSIGDVLRYQLLELSAGSPELSAARLGLVLWCDSDAGVVAVRCMEEVQPGSIAAANGNTAELEWCSVETAAVSTRKSHFVAAPAATSAAFSSTPSAAASSAPRMGPSLRAADAVVANGTLGGSCSSSGSSSLAVAAGGGDIIGSIGDYCPTSPRPEEGGEHPAAPAPAEQGTDASARGPPAYARATDGDEVQPLAALAPSGAASSSVERGEDPAAAAATASLGSKGGAPKARKVLGIARLVARLQQDTPAAAAASPAGES